LQHTIADANSHLANYRFDLFAHTLYDFTWNEFCDWYLELSKPILMNKTQSAEILYGTRHTLLSVLDVLLRLLHPIMPYITEEIWQRVAPLLGPHPESIMLSRYPHFQENLLNVTAESECDWIKEVIKGVRTIRSEKNISPGKLLVLQLKRGDEKDRARESRYHDLLKTLAKLEKIEWLSVDDVITDSSSFFLGELELFVPLVGFIDQAAENARIQAELQKMMKEISFIEGKLNNPQFVEKAPAAVIEKERARLQELEMKRQKMSGQN
jgi:valyl-tRNA synthetase